MSRHPLSRFVSPLAAALVIASGLLLPAQAQDVAGAYPKAATTAICTPTHVGMFDNRIHVRCSVAANGIFYFAVATADPNLAARALAVFSTAFASGHDVRIYYDTADTSGTAFGCGSGDCRRATGIELL